MTKPIAYTVFHINMAFSSIEEEERKTVIERCYWPLLNLAKDGFPIGIEATSYSLRVIADIDPSWIAKLKELIQTGAVEFVGSGYVQMIAPLVPPEVTRWNLRLAQQDYCDLLGTQPKIALVNEQAYAPGLVPLYLEAGYEALMMDWSEPASHNKEWKREFAGRPQLVEGEDGHTIPVLWSDAISFQKFQRYAHGEIEADEYFEFLSLQLGAGSKSFPLYTSDAEIFDFRPGRFNSEAELPVISEYERIRLLFEALYGSDEIELGKPSDALLKLEKNQPPIRLETPAAPIPVKKQRKYNVLRWAVSGQNDLFLNTHCWRLYEVLKSQETASAGEWRILCGYWASDFRTHITKKRWEKLNAVLPAVLVQAPSLVETHHIIPPSVKVTQDRRFVTIETDKAHLVLNVQKGLAVHSFGFGAYEGIHAGAPAANALIGTLSHGFYHDIAFGADFYSGHFIFEPAGIHKVTDLAKIAPKITWVDSLRAVQVVCTIDTPWGPLIKKLLWSTEQPKLEVSYDGPVPLPLDGSFRLGHVALNPRAFDAPSLYYAVHNGGERFDCHRLWDDGLVESDHGASVSRLVSATTGVGMTGDILELGDKDHCVRISMQRTDAAGVGFITSKAVDDSFFVRAAISLCEVDETLRSNGFQLSKNISPPILRFGIELEKRT